MKFTFKTEKPTGKWRSFGTPFHYIKLKGKQVGEIVHHKPHTIWLNVIKKDIMEDGNPNCTWRRTTLPNNFTSVDAAKEWLNENFDSVCELNLHGLEK